VFFPALSVMDGTGFLCRARPYNPVFSYFLCAEESKRMIAAPCIKAIPRLSGDSKGSFSRAGEKMKKQREQSDARIDYAESRLNKTIVK